jgi:hypothetical protein
MKPAQSKLLLIISGAIIFNIIFWNEKLGVNAVLFDIFICAAVITQFPFSLKNNISKWILTGHLITTTLLIIQNTMISKISFSITLLLFISFSQYIHRSALYAGGSVMLNYVLFVPGFFNELKEIKGKAIHSRNWFKNYRMLLIPISILAIFLIIYSSANTIFSDIFLQGIAAVKNWFNNFFLLFPFERIEFLTAGFFIVGGLLLRSRSTYFSDADCKQKNNLSRKKTFFKKWKESSWADMLTVITGKKANGILALKNEYITGTVSLLLLNILLLIINFIDVKYVWLGFTYSNDRSMATYVHEGAGMLILSIVLAMFLLLFFFRGNLNFYKRNKWLRYGAYLWIFQNCFLVLSVLMRDYYYISHYGLAYKRIGLLFFLAMVLSGLFTIFIKICYNKTAYYLLRVNAWVAIVLLVFASAFHWDKNIAEYNIARKSLVPVDVSFLLSLSDEALPIIQKHKEVLANDKYDKFYYNGNYYNAFMYFEYRKKDFFTEQKQYTWLSWNATDAKVKRELSTTTPVSSLK